MKLWKSLALANQKQRPGYDVKHIDTEFLTQYICSDDVITLQQVSHGATFNGWTQHRDKKSKRGGGGCKDKTKTLSRTQRSGLPD